MRSVPALSVMAVVLLVADAAAAGSSAPYGTLFTAPPIASDAASGRPASSAPSEAPRGLDPAAVDAQSFIKDNVERLIRRVGVHGNVSFRHPIDDDVTKGTSFGASIGLSPGRSNGWKYPLALTLFREHLHSPNGEEFATVRTLGLMAGIGYGWHFGRLSTGVQIQTGLALNHERLSGDVPAAFGVPKESVAIDAHSSIHLRPEVKAEYFLTEKFTLRTSLDYMWLHPDIDVTTPTERFSDQWDLSNIHANVGIGFYPFRK